MLMEINGIYATQGKGAEKMKIIITYFLNCCEIHPG